MSTSGSDSGFPLVCGGCLGDGSVLRMRRATSSACCKLCDRPVTVFHWRPGSNSQRERRTSICRNCARVKHICQSCLLDLELKIAPELRDAALVEQERSAALPQNDVNRQLMFEQQDRMLEIAGSAKLNPAEILARLERDREERIRVAMKSVCPYFLRSQCARGIHCGFTHDIPEEKKGCPWKDFVPKVPGDKRCKSVFVGDLLDLEEQPGFKEELRERLEQFGRISSLNIITGRAIAFAEFVRRECAERAVVELWGNFVLRNTQLRIDWARAPASGQKRRRKAPDVEESRGIPMEKDQDIGEKPITVVRENAYKFIKPGPQSVASSSTSATDHLPLPPGIRINKQISKPVT